MFGSIVKGEVEGICPSTRENKPHAGTSLLLHIFCTLFIIITLRWNHENQSQIYILKLLKKL